MLKWLKRKPKDRSKDLPLARQFAWTFWGFLGVMVLAVFLFFRAINPPAISAPMSEAVSSGKAMTDILVVGDTGSGASFQQDVATQMLKTHQQNPVKLVLHLGDILYPDGDIKAFGESRYLKYYRPLMNAGVPFRVALGNHDLVKGFSPKILAFYKMPSRYYTFQEGSVAFLALDTNLGKDPIQLKWLENQLQTLQNHPTFRWIVVYGHHPIYSSGMHGNSKELIRNLKPLLEKYNVDFYLAGHDHNYERFSAENGVNYVVSGGGGSYLREFKSLKPAKTLFRASQNHFLRLSFGQTEAVLKVINAKGEVIDEARYQPHSKTEQLKAS